MEARSWIGLTLGLIVLAAVPALVADGYWRHMFIVSFIYAVVASNWNLSLGKAGIFNFAHITFFGLGAYTAAIATKTFGVNPWFAILLAGAVSPLTAVIVAAPVARLKGIYVVLVTFAVNQLAMQLVLSQAEVTGGADGLVRIPFLTIGTYSFIRDTKLGYYFVALAILVCSSAFLLIVAKSSFGQSLKAVRDAPDYAAARGISIARQRIIVLVLSAVFTAVAGGFYTVYLRVASPEVFGFGITSLALSMVLVGGVNSVFGPIVAALAITFATEAMASVQGFADLRFIIIAVAMILVLRLAPGGVLELVSHMSVPHVRRSER